MSTTRRSPKNVGIIGLGIIGSRVASGLRQNGFNVFVWNRSAKLAPNFLGSPAEVAEECAVVQIFVADAEATLKMIDAMSPALGADHVVISHGTIGLEGTLEAARRVTATGAQFLEAPFTGSKIAAEKRQLVYYIGGDDATFQRVKPLLEASSKAIVKIGKVGQAAVVKVVTNMISAASVQVLAESLAIVRGAGIAPEVLATAIEQNAMRSGVTDLKLPKMIAGDYEPHFSLKHMHKDVKLGLDLAQQFSLNAPGSSAISDIMQSAIARGWGDYDFAAVAKLYENGAKGLLLKIGEA